MDTVSILLLLIVILVCIVYIAYVRNYNMPVHVHTKPATYLTFPDTVLMCPLQGCST